jgi:hypothetical protein
MRLGGGIGRAGGHLLFDEEKSWEQLGDDFLI